MRLIMKSNLKGMRILRVLAIQLLLILLSTQVIAQEEEFVEEFSLGAIMESPKELQVIENSIKNMKIKKLFFEGLIEEEFDSIKHEFDELNKLKVRKKLNGKVEANGIGSIDPMGCSLGIIDFDSKSNPNKHIYRISYLYKKNPDGQIKIKVLTINKNAQKIAQFPKLYTITEDQIRRLDKVLKGEDNKAKIELLSSFLRNSEKSYEHGIFPYVLRDDDFARYHGSLSWYYLLEGKGEEALKHAKKGLGLSRGKEKWISVNLILAYFFESETKKGLELFLEHKDENYKGKTIKNMLISDINELEEKGFKLPNKREIKQALEDK